MAYKLTTLVLAMAVLAWAQESALAFYVGRQSVWDHRPAIYGETWGPGGSYTTHATILTAATYNGYTYLFNAMPLGVQAAAAECTAAGGVLPIGDTPAERDFIQGVFQPLLDYGMVQSGLNSIVRWLVNFNATTSGGNETFAVYEPCAGYDSSDPSPVDCNSSFPLKPLQNPARPICSETEPVPSPTPDPYDPNGQSQVPECNNYYYEGCGPDSWLARVGHVCKVLEPPAADYEHPDMAGVVAISRYVCPGLDMSNVTTNPCLQCPDITCSTKDEKNTWRVTSMRLTWPQLNFPSSHYPPHDWSGTLPYLTELDITSYNANKQRLLWGGMWDDAHENWGLGKLNHNDTRAIICNATSFLDYELYSNSDGHCQSRTSGTYPRALWCYHVMPRYAEVPSRLADVAPSLKVLRVSYNNTDGIAACWRSQGGFDKPVCSLFQLQQLHVSTGGGFGQRWAAPTSPDVPTSELGLKTGYADSLRYQQAFSPSDGCPERLQMVMLPCYGSLTKLNVLNITIPGGRFPSELREVSNNEFDAWKSVLSLNLGQSTVYGRRGLFGAFADTRQVVNAYNTPLNIPRNPISYSDTSTLGQADIRSTAKMVHYMPAHNAVPPLPVELPSEWGQLQGLQEIHVQPAMAAWVKAGRQAFELQLPTITNSYSYDIPGNWSCAGYSIYRCEQQIAAAVEPLGTTAVGYRLNYTSDTQAASDLRFQITSRYGVYLLPGEGSGSYFATTGFSTESGVNSVYFQDMLMNFAIVSSNKNSPGWNAITGSESSAWFPVTGSIPDAWLTGLGNLTTLAMPAMQLSGTLPEQLGQLQSLEHLDLAYNPNITGPLPESLAQCSRLRQLWLQQNAITGTIPDNYEDLKQLQHVNLAWNALTGAFPEWQEMPTLAELHLSGNKLSGALPGGIASTSAANKIRFWFVDTFGVTGRATPAVRGGLTRWPALQLVCLDNVMLKGQIPDSWQADLCTRKDRVRVDAANNTLTFTYIDNSQPASQSGTARQMRFTAALQPRCREEEEEEHKQHPSVVNELQTWLKASRYAAFALSLYYGLKVCLLLYDIGSDVLVILRMWPNAWLWYFFGGLCAPSVVGAACVHIYLTRKARWMADNWVPEQYRELLPEDHPCRSMRHIGVYSAIAEGSVPCDFLAWFLFPLLVVFTLPLMMIKFLTFGKVQFWFAKHVDGVNYLFLYHLLVGLVEAPMSAAIITVLYTMPITPRSPTFLSYGQFVMNILSSMIDMLCLWYSIHEMAVSGNSLMSIFRLFLTSCAKLGPDNENLSLAFDVDELIAAVGAAGATAEVQLINQADGRKVGQGDSSLKAAGDADSAGAITSGPASSGAKATKQPALLPALSAELSASAVCADQITPQLLLGSGGSSAPVLGVKVAALQSELTCVKSELASIKGLLLALLRNMAEPLPNVLAAAAQALAGQQAAASPPPPAAAGWDRPIGHLAGHHHLLHTHTSNGRQHVPRLLSW